MALDIFQVRSIKNEKEMTLFCHLATEAFVHSPTSRSRQYFKDRWRWAIEQTPGFTMDQIYAVFEGDLVVGGYQLIERQIRIRGIEILTGCISAVVTHPEYRRRGIATSLMNHAINIAQDKQYALLILAGIPNFYQQFGYVDIFDYTEHAFLRYLIPDVLKGNHFVRLANQKDAEPLLELYKRHFYDYTGSFSRSLLQQSHYLQTWIPDNAPTVCQDPNGKLSGYLVFPLKRDKSHAIEIAADNVETAVALLQYHNKLASSSSKFEELWWPMPYDSPLFQMLSDSMIFKGNSVTENPVRSWSVKSVTYIQPSTGWVARIADSKALIYSLLPLFRHLWQNSQLLWSGTLSLVLDQDIFHLHFDETGNLFENKNSNDETSLVVKISQRIFVQLIFGYRNLEWALSQNEVDIPPNIIPIFKCLFPSGHSWISSSDSF
jgi:GNAT superfamily N-acetyltransferase